MYYATQTQRSGNGQVFTVTADSTLQLFCFPPTSWRATKRHYISCINTRQRDPHEGLHSNTFVFGGSLCFGFCFVFFIQHYVWVWEQQRLFLFYSCMFFPLEFLSLKCFNIVAFKDLGNCSVFTLCRHHCIGLFAIFCYMSNIQPYDVIQQMVNMLFFFPMYINIYVYIQSACTTSLSFISAFFSQLNSSDFRNMSVHFFCESWRCNEQLIDSDT